MAWTLDSDRPIYTQLMEIIQMQIVSGRYQPGSRLPSVRELAGQACVNPNTMQKALSELEDMGLLVTNRTTGRTVTTDNGRILQIREKLALEQLHLFFSAMKKLGYGKKDIVTLVENVTEEGTYE